ncbi:hypothetical protein WH47_01658 [Habropoda laboriosa]|uniref:Uncharacterized protein n=1 Tax=Habropoda laboriosa TaxID=597456 RepID=A0A0L7R447_9HYME|nr:hypothetical protein WH47_01658 [Habropoda laboriosa]
MNQNRNNQERDDTYQNIGHGSRGFQNRPGGSVQVHPNLNPNYQNPVDLVHNYNRNRQPQEPEENIYERLDNDDDDGEHNENNGENRLGRLGRNCFSTENIAYASTGRAIYPLGSNCTRSFCRHLDPRYLCHHCHNLHNRLRHQDGFASNSRHYIYQLPRNCRCPVCRGEYSYVKLPVMPCRPTESLRMECHCRNPNNCSCRCKVLPNCNSSAQFNRYLDWISRGSPSVNNPLYATVHIGRPSVSALGNTTGGGNLSNSIDPGASTSNMSAPTSTVNESSASSNVRLMFPLHNPTSRASVCPTNRSTERQHTCDDSCIRNQSGSVTGICQFLGRCERAECNHGRLSVHWWFINRWLPPWNHHYFDRNIDTVSSMEEEPREQHETDSDDT